MGAQAMKQNMRQQTAANRTIAAQENAMWAAREKATRSQQKAIQDLAKRQAKVYADNLKAEQQIEAARDRAHAKRISQEKRYREEMLATEFRKIGHINKAARKGDLTGAEVRGLRGQRSQLVAGDVIGSLHGGEKGLLGLRAKDMTAGLARNFAVVEAGLASATKGTLAYNAMVEKQLLLQKAWGAQLVKTGKDLQWQGRQLTVGLSVPLGFATAMLSKVALDVDAQITRIRKVYNGHGEELDRVAQRARNFATEMASALGIVHTETLEVTAAFAQMGFQGDELFDMAEQTLRIARLGEIQQDVATELVRTTRQVFDLEGKGLIDTLNRFNKLENETALSLKELADGLPIVATVANQLGMNAEETAASLAVLREAGVEVNVGATALRNSLSRLTDPTKEAHEIFSRFGIDLSQIFAENGNDALEVLKDLAVLVEQQKESAPQLLAAFSNLAGVRQTGRLYELLIGLTELDKQGSSAQRAFDAVSTTLEATAIAAASARQELDEWYNSSAGQFDRLKTRLLEVAISMGEGLVPTALFLMKTAAGIGEGFLDAMSAVDKFLDTLGPLGTAIEKIAKFSIFGAIVAGPIVQFTGLFRNFLGSLLQGFTRVKLMVTGVSGSINQLAHSIGLATGVGEVYEQQQINLSARMQFATSALGQMNHEMRESIVGHMMASDAATRSIGAFAATGQAAKNAGVGLDIMGDKARIAGEKIKSAMSQSAAATKTFSGRLLAIGFGASSALFGMTQIPSMMKSIREEGLMASNSLQQLLMVVINLGFAMAALKGTGFASALAGAATAIGGLVGLSGMAAGVAGLGVVGAAAAGAFLLFKHIKGTKKEILTASQYGDRLADSMGLAAAEVADIHEEFKGMRQSSGEVLPLGELMDLVQFLNSSGDPARAFERIAASLALRGASPEKIASIAHELQRISDIKLPEFLTGEGVIGALKDAGEVSREASNNLWDAALAAEAFWHNLADEKKRSGVNRPSLITDWLLDNDINLRQAGQEMADALDNALSVGDWEAARLVMIQYKQILDQLPPVLRSQIAPAMNEIIDGMEDKWSLNWEKGIDSMGKFSSVLSIVTRMLDSTNAEDALDPGNATSNLQSYKEQLKDIDGIISDFTGRYRDAIGDIYGDLYDEIDAEFERRSDSISQFYDDQVDAAEKAYDDERDALEDRYDAELDALKKIHKQDEDINRARERERRKQEIRERLRNTMEQSAIDFDAAVASGSLGEAHSILQNRLVAQREAMAEIARVDEEALKDRNKAEFEIAKDLLDDKYDLEKEALADKFELQKEELRNAERHAQDMLKVAQDRVEDEIKEIEKIPVANEEAMQDSVDKVNGILRNSGIGVTFSTSVADAMEKAREEMTNEEGWKNVGEQIINGIGHGIFTNLDSLLNAIIDYAINGETNFVTTGGGEISDVTKAWLSGTPVSQLHSGGRVSPGMPGGRGLERDERPAILQTGEYVMQRSAVNRIGVHNLEQMNKYHSGGLVEGISNIVAKGSVFGAIMRMFMQASGSLAGSLGGSMSDLQSPDSDWTWRYSDWKYKLQPHVISTVASALASMPGAQHVVSAYRDPVVNAAVGGAKNSRHMYGLGVDIVGSKGAHYGELVGIANFFRKNYPKQIDKVFAPDNDPKGHDDHVHLSFKPMGLSKGGVILKNNTLANLHKGEHVLRAPVSQALEQGIFQMANGSSGGGDTIVVNIGKVVGERDEARKMVNTIMNEIEKKQARRAGGRRVG